MPIGTFTPMIQGCGKTKEATLDRQCTHGALPDTID